MANHFKTSVDEMCSLFSRGVRILSEGGGSMGFREYHQLATYISEFANKTGFPKFPLKGETELALSRYFQVHFFKLHFILFYFLVGTITVPYLRIAHSQFWSHWYSCFVFGTHLVFHVVDGHSSVY